MKKGIKTILGNHLVLRIRNLKLKYFPTKEQQKRSKKVEEDINQRTLFYSNFIQKNDLCFDVGANVGNRIIPLLAIGAKIVAIEPQEDCYKFLKLLFGKKIEIVTKGLCESECVKEFYISNANTISSFSNEWIDSVKDGRFKGCNWDRVVEVKMTTLDKLIDKYGLPKFIKIDVEGYELEVLKGLTKPIEIISFEYTVPEQINRVIECIEQINTITQDIECNYSIGESMSFVSQVWQSVDEIKKLIVTKEFIETGFGDVYVRIKQHYLIKCVS